MLQELVLYVMLVAMVAVVKVPFFAMNVQRIIIFTLMESVYRLAQITFIVMVQLVFVRIVLSIVNNALMEVFATYVSLVIISMMITHALIKVYALTMNICTKENAYQNVQITFIFFMSFLLAMFALVIV